MVYFVKPGGFGNGITQWQAGEFVDIAKKLQAGDILYLYGGVYRYTEQITLNLKGDINKEILIIADDPLNPPVFDFRYQPYGSRDNSDCNGFRLFGEYAHINGIKVAYSGYKGIRSELSNSILENIEVYGCCDSGIHMCSGGNNQIINCVSHDNFGYKRMDGDVVKFGFDSDGISDKLHNGLPNKFINCKSYNNTDDGFDFYGRCTMDFTYMNGCESYSNGVCMFNMTDYPRYEIDKEWFDKFREPSNYHTINGDRLISLTEYPAFGNGNGFKLGGNKQSHNIQLHHCTSNKNRMKGFDQNHNSGEMKLFNCYAEYNRAFDYGFRDSSCGNVHFYNCVSKTNNISIRTLFKHTENCSW